ncbi:MAG: arginine--tRNA ligase [Ignavibacteriales bacterium]|nr:arginine--tRNA ligase [Ignavibacteriales bacterium]
MVEYAQPNTHHSFHIGHCRNTILGEALARLVEFAGFETIRASYPGDLGLGVITVMWIYDKFYKGQEPEGVHERGQWLAKLYVEATNLLEKKENETPEETAQREAYEAERREMYRKWDAGDPQVRELWTRHPRVESGRTARHPGYAGCEDGCLVLRERSGRTVQSHCG